MLSLTVGLVDFMESYSLVTYSIIRENVGCPSIGSVLRQTTLCQMRFDWGYLLQRVLRSSWHSLDSPPGLRRGYCHRYHPETIVTHCISFFAPLMLYSRATFHFKPLAEADCYHFFI